MADVATRGSTTHFDIPRAREGGLTAPFFAIYVAASYAEGGAARRALELIDITHRVVDAHPKDLTLATTAAEIRAAKQAGRIALLMGIEGGHAIEDSMGALREMYREGVRYMTLTHVNTNHWADSSGPFYEPDFDPKKSAVHNGLSEFGKGRRQGDEPDRHDRRYLARVRRDDPRRARGLARAGHGVALVVPRAIEHPAQPDR